MRYKPATALIVLLAVTALATASLVLNGCGPPASESIIPALPAEQQGTDIGLSPGIRPLSSGPGDKSSPSWSPEGNRIAYVQDGYVVEKPLFTQDSRRQTTKDLGAEKVEWASSSPQVLAILGPDKTPESSIQDNETMKAIYQTLPGREASLKQIAGNIETMSSNSRGNQVIAAATSPSSQNELLLIQEDKEPVKIPLNDVKGRITGISASSDGQQVILAAQDTQDGMSSFTIYSFSFLSGKAQQLVQLPPGWKVLGSPQWTSKGIYYLAGKVQNSTDITAYALYRLAGNATESIAAMGEDFVVSSVQASPSGDRIAIVGRRSPASSTNLYILDLVSSMVTPVTKNDSMEIKTAPDDIKWSPDERYIAIVARGNTSQPRVYSASAASLITDFYNIYQVPVR